MLCKHCNKECKNDNSLRNHERLCPNNPERKYVNGMTGKKGSNQYTTGLSTGHTDETKLKISKAATGRRHTAETKAKLSKIRSDWMKANPEKCRRKESYMETSFKRWLIENNIQFEFEVHIRNTELNKNYFVDFMFGKLIVELDGNQHEQRKEHDEIRDTFIRKLVYDIIRITHEEYKNKTKQKLLEDLLMPR